MKTPILELRDLHAGYGTGEVLKGVHLEVNEGEIVTLLGGNGAGKTTTLSAITRVVRHQKGQVLWMGHVMEQKTPDQVLGEGIVLCPEARHIFPLMTVEENLRIGAYLFDQKKDSAKMDQVFQYFPKLAERRRQLGGTLSGGEQQMLAIGRSLMSEPKLLMLDEPSLGLAPLIVEKIFEILLQINRSGIPILLVEQNARQALKIAHRGYVMVTGKIVHSDSGENLLKSDEVRRAYLGE
jgi:branched-chain amino acid transport system ATP-binding protein